MKLKFKSDSKIIGAGVAVLIGIIAGVIITANLHLFKKITERVGLCAEWTFIHLKRTALNFLSRPYIYDERFIFFY